MSEAELTSDLDRLFYALAQHGLERPGDAEIAAALDLARVVARGVVRRGAPLACYAAGLAMTASTPPAERAERLRELVGHIEALAAETGGSVEDGAGGSQRG